MVVLAIAAILVTLAVAQLGNSTNSLERQNIAREFKISLERARFDSVKRRPFNCTDMARVELTGPNSFKYVTDKDMNGILDPLSETTVVDFSTSSSVEIVSDPPATYPIIIRFDQRGNVSSGPCGAEVPFTTPTVFCQSPCTAATAGPSNSSIVYVSPTGTVAVLRGGESVPAFSAPDVTNVAVNTQINRDLAVWTGSPLLPDANASPGGETPSPSPSASPTSTPTPGPSPTISPSPSPSPTATPTATPAPTATPQPTATPGLPSCSLNQRPGNPATCDCQPPWFVGKNGKCS